MSVFINPYKKGSRGAFDLKQGLVGKGCRVFVTGREPRFPSPLIVCWGNSELEFTPKRLDRVVNEPHGIRVMANKLRFFQHVGHSDMVPRWATEPAEASSWGGKVVCRHRLEASGGAGIEIYDPTSGQPCPRAPLYTEYVKKTHEYRVHVGRSLSNLDFRVLLVQRKVFQRREGLDAPKSWEVRNHNNGFVFVQNDGGDRADEAAKAAAVELSLRFMNEHFPFMHFAALDILYSTTTKQAHVLEGNTAPGMEGNTVQVYTDYIHGLAQEARAA